MSEEHKCLGLMHFIHKGVARIEKARYMHYAAWLFNALQSLGLVFNDHPKWDLSFNTNGWFNSSNNGSGPQVVVWPLVKRYNLPCDWNKLRRFILEVSPVEGPTSQTIPHITTAPFHKSLQTQADWRIYKKVDQYFGKNKTVIQSAFWFMEAPIPFIKLFRIFS